MQENHVICPRCNKAPLLLVIKDKHVFSIKDIGLRDIIPLEKIDVERIEILECGICNWRGGVEEYNECKNGLVPLFTTKEDDYDF